MFIVNKVQKLVILAVGSDYARNVVASTSEGDRVTDRQLARNQISRMKVGLLCTCGNC